jgi:hypothetical protein
MTQMAGKGHRMFISTLLAILEFGNSFGSVPAGGLLALAWKPVDDTRVIT